MQHKNPGVKNALTTYDVENNESFIDALFQSRLHVMTDITATDAAPIRRILNDFVNHYGISLGSENVSQVEEERLKSILIEALQKKEFDLRSALFQWMQTLKHAVSGRGAHIDLYSGRSSGIAADLMNHGRVSLSTLGTDLDARHFLGKNLTHPGEIRKTGAYILPPVSLTQGLNTAPTIALQTLLHDAFDSIVKNKIKNDLYVCIPVNCGDSHWRLAEFCINVNSNGESEIKYANLWDSMKGDAGQIKASPAFKNFTTVVESFAIEGVSAHPQLELTGRQTNSHSCLDYVLQKAYQETHIESDILAAKDAKEMRFAIVKQIVINHPQIDNAAVEHLQIKDKNIVIGNQFEQAYVLPLDDSTEKAGDTFLSQFDNKEQSQVLTEEDINFQITFDAVFSEHLQALYDKNPGKIKDESGLLAEARRRAMQEIGFFPEPRQATPFSSVDGHTHPKPKK